MGWTAQDIEKLRKGQNGQTAAGTGNGSARSSAAGTSRRQSGTGWTEADIAALRGSSTGTRTTEAWENRGAGTSTRGTGTNGTKSSTAGNNSAHSQNGSLANEVLAQMGVNARSTNPKLQLAVPQNGTGNRQAYLGKEGIVQPADIRGGTAQPEWLTKAQPEKRTAKDGTPVTGSEAEKNTAPAARVMGTVKPTEEQRIAGIARGEEGIWGAMAQTQKETFTLENEKRDKSRFRQLNSWMDADPRHRELVDLMRMTGNQLETDTGIKETDWTTQDTGGKTPKYTDADLLKMGYSQQEINEAREYITDYDSISVLEKFGTRAHDLVGSWVDSPMGALIGEEEALAQKARDGDDSRKNLDTLRKEVAGDERKRTLLETLETLDSTQTVKKDDSGLLAMGYTQDEIDDMRGLYEATKVSTSMDKEKSIGYQWSKQGEKLGQSALSGLSPQVQTVAGIVASAAQNLAVGQLMGPEWVLPMLSGSGASDALVQSMERGDSADKTSKNVGLKFGAGYIINSVGAADLAKTMGSDYAKDTLAGKLADAVRSVAADGALAQQYPAIANAISGGVDNAMQAFVETYADKAIDAALGDSEAADSMFTTKTFLDAVESGLTGGASGALGGAVGTGLAKLNSGNASWAGQIQQMEAEDAAARVQQETETKTAAEGAPSSVVADATPPSPDRGKAYGGTEEAVPSGEALSVAEQTAVNDDPAVHTPAQNASIAQYKDSVDPEMKAYVDKVREGKELPPYMVTETSDRMRSAMQELTGMQRVGDRTLLDANGVKHITNRHGGGDGSADGTMKESADVARAAYVLNNFDNAYLATRKADGYFDSRGKRAPIVIFEKKIDGSHIIVEAVCDTKRGRNFIVSEYLSSVGVPEKEIAKALQSPMDAAESDARDTSETLATETSAIPMEEALRPPMDAVADPRDTSETLNAVTSAGDSRRTIAEPAEADHRGQPGTPLKSTDATTVQRTGSSADGTPDTNVTQQAVEVNRNTLKSSPADYADVELRADMANLDTDSWTRAEQAETARTLAEHYRMSDAAVQTVADNMPAGVGAEVYAPAAAMMYRLGVNGEGESFADALKMTGGGGALSGSMQQVMAVGDAGRTALKLAYLQGKGEAERYRETKAAELGKRPGKEALRPDAGTLYGPDGTVSKSKRADDALIELTAGANGVAAQRVVKGLADNAKGLIRSAAGAVFYSGEADTATVLHETLHEVNSWDAKGGQELIDAFEHYLVVQNGMESVQQLVESYLDRYEKAGQSLTYNQAMEEITADAMQSIFGDEESFKNFLRQQAAEAKMNAAAQGKTDRVMTRIENLLKKVLSDIKSLLVKEPTNAAAKAARTLTEAQLADLQQIYFNHQADAGENYRAALEANGGANKNAADISDAAAGEGKYSIDPDYAEKIDEWDKEGRSDDEVFILGRTGDTLQQLGARENDIYMNSEKINRILHDHPEMTLEEIKRIPEVLDDPAMVLTSQNKGRSRQNTRLVMFGNVKAKDGRPVLCILDLRPVENHIVINDMQKVASAYTKDVNPVGFVRNSTVLYLSENKEKTTELFRTLGFKMPSELQSSGLIGSIAYGNQDVKLSGVKFTELEGAPETRYQLDVDSEDVEAAKEAQRGKGREAAETVQKIAEMTEGAKVSDESLERIARKMVKASDSKADAKTLANRLRALSDYLSSGKADMAQAHGFVLDMAQQIMERSAKKNDELWKQYPELHKMGMSLEKGSKDYNEVLYRYGSWAEARKELAKHGVQLTLTKNGEISRWDADFTELQGIGGGLFPTETPTSAADALEAMAAAHDAIRPTMESAYDSNWDAAKQEMAMELWGEYLGLPGIASEKNAALRAEFAEKREQMNTAARKEAMRLQAEANLAAAKQRGAERQKMRKGYAAALSSAEAKAADAQSRADAQAQKAKEKAQRLVAQAQARNAEKLKQMRESRDKDNTRRAIRRATGELTKMFEHPSEKKYVPEYLLDKVRPVLQLANEAIGNRETAQRLAQWAHRGEEGWTYAPMKDDSAQLEKTMNGLTRGIQKEMSNSDRAQLEWQNSGIEEAISEWLLDVNENRETEIKTLREKIESAKQYTREDESPSWTAYVDGLNLKLAALENGGMAALSADELRGLRDIIDQTLHIIKIDNVVVGAQEDIMIDEFAEGAKAELKEAKGIDKKEGKLHKLNRKFNSSTG